jgi:hypothetical protein
MLALFEVLSFKGWLDVRDVLIKALGPVSSSKAYFFIIIRNFDNLGSCDLHPYLHFPRMHDWFDPFRGCGDRELFGK